MKAKGIRLVIIGVYCRIWLQREHINVLLAVVVLTVLISLEDIAANVSWLGHHKLLIWAERVIIVVMIHCLLWSAPLLLHTLFVSVTEVTGAHHFRRTVRLNVNLLILLPNGLKLILANSSSKSACSILATRCCSCRMSSIILFLQIYGARLETRSWRFIRICVWVGLSGPKILRMNTHEEGHLVAAGRRLWRITFLAPRASPLLPTTPTAQIIIVVLASPGRLYSTRKAGHLNLSHPLLYFALIKQKWRVKRGRISHRSRFGKKLKIGGQRLSLLFGGMISGTVRIVANPTGTSPCFVHVRMVLTFFPSVRKLAQNALLTPIFVISDALSRIPLGTLLRLIGILVRLASKVLPIVRIDTQFSLVVFLFIRTPCCLEVEHVKVAVLLVEFDQINWEFLIGVSKSTKLPIIALLILAQERLTKFGLVLFGVVKFFNRVVGVGTSIADNARLPFLFYHILASFRPIGAQFAPPIFHFVMIHGTSLWIVTFGVQITLFGLEKGQVEKNLHSCCLAASCLRTGWVRGLRALGLFAVGGTCIANLRGVGRGEKRIWSTVRPPFQLETLISSAAHVYVILCAIADLFGIW